MTIARVKNRKRRKGRCRRRLLPVIVVVEGGTGLSMVNRIAGTNVVASSCMMVMVIVMMMMMMMMMVVMVMMMTMMMLTMMGMVSKTHFVVGATRLLWP
jgi:hypothetical protein